MTLLKFQIVVSGPQLFNKEYPAKLFHREISPHHILTLNKKSWGILSFIFGFSGVIDHAKTVFAVFRCNYLGQIRSQKQNGFSP
jgi:hypothetical protein